MVDLISLSLLRTRSRLSCSRPHLQRLLKVGARAGNPPNADALDILANTERHAKDDCGDAKGAHAKEMRVATHFVHKTGIKVTEPGFDCGTYAEIDAAAEACRVKEDCVAFGIKGGKPDCLLPSFGLTSNDKDSELYIKVKNQAGANLVDGQRRFQAPSDQTDAVTERPRLRDPCGSACVAPQKVVFEPCGIIQWG